MISRIIKLNLKSNNEIMKILILILVGVLITNLHYMLVDVEFKKILMADIIIETYGGLDAEYSIFNIYYFILWITPYIVILNLVNISTIDRFRDNITLILPRIKDKKKWYIAFNLSIIIKICIYMLVLFVSTLIVIWIKSGNEAFHMTYINRINLNQYFISIYVLIINILMLISIQFFLNNLYCIFYKSNEASVFGIILYIFPIFYSKNANLNKVALINSGMIKRYEMFENGFIGLNFVNSSIFIIVFIIINFLIGIFIIKKKDILDI